MRAPRTQALLRKGANVLAIEVHRSPESVARHVAVGRGGLGPDCSTLALLAAKVSEGIAAIPSDTLVIAPGARLAAKCRHLH